MRAVVLLLILAVTSHAAVHRRPPPPSDQLITRGVRAAPRVTPLAEADYRLPLDIKPTEYEVNLVPFFEDQPEDLRFKFDGQVKITLEVVKATSTLKLHAYDMNFTKDDITIKTSEGTDIPIMDMSRPEDPKDDTHFLIINTISQLATTIGYELEIKYRGNLNEDLDGFYRSKYTDTDGTEKYLAVTQFEQHGARRAFPCFDEPIFKAKFTINIAKAPRHTVLSNMPITSDTDPIDAGEYPNLVGWTWTRFEQSIEMSSYLVAFTVSEFVALEHPLNGEGKLDQEYRVWARPGLHTQGAIANQISPYIIEYMTYFTGHTYMLPKVDQIAIPDFSAGAMENWGLVTYRETSLLFEEGVSTSSNRQRIKTVVTHELAHQWFGNLVTCEWWSHIWLNEGFATYFEYHALDKFEPTWQLEAQFVYQEMHTVLQTDALVSTHPLLSEVDSPASSSAAFDNIAYNKGGSIIRFMVYLMGEDNFKAGINEYLEARQWKTAVPTDLFDALANHITAANLPPSTTFQQVMDTWHTQAGYPVVSVHRNYDDSKTAHVNQTRFLTFREEGEEYPEAWWVALTYTGEKSPNFEDTGVKHWFKDDTPLISLPVEDTQWLLVNPKQTGYYRVNYDLKNWGLLSAALDSDKFRVIHLMNRAQLMDDALALARAGLLPYDTALDTTAYLWHETEYIPWAAGLSALSYLWDRLSFQDDTRGPFQRYMRMHLDPAYDLVNGFTVTEDDSHLMRYKRSLILRWACANVGQEACNSEAANLFRLWKNSENPDTNNPIEPDLKSVVYCAGMREGGREEYDFLFARYEASTQVASEQSLILTALGCASDTTLLQEYLDESIAEDSRIRWQDARSVHSAVYGNYLGVDLALDFILENWERCQTVYQGPNNLGRAITGVAEKCNTMEQHHKLSEFYTIQEEAGVMDPALLRKVQAAISTVEESLAWHEAHRDTVVSYLLDRAPSSAAPLRLSGVLLLLPLLVAKLAHTLF